MEQNHMLCSCLWIPKFKKCKKKKKKKKKKNHKQKKPKQLLNRKIKFDGQEIDVHTFLFFA